MVCNFLSDIWKFFSKNQFAYTQKNTKIGGGIKWSKIGGVELPANYFNILLTDFSHCLSVLWCCNAGSEPLSGLCCM